MQNVPKSDDTGNDGALAYIAQHALGTLDFRLAADRLELLGTCVGYDAVELDYVAPALRVLDDASALIVERWAGYPRDRYPPPSTPLFRQLLILDSRDIAGARLYFMLANGTADALPSFLGVIDRAGALPSCLTVVETESGTTDQPAGLFERHRELLDRVRGDAQLELSARRHIDGVTPAPPPANRADQRRRLQSIAERVESVYDVEALPSLVLLDVARVVRWGPRAPSRASLVRHALPSILDAATPDDSGAALVRRALVALGHRPDDFEASARATRNRAAKAETLASWRTKANERFRREVRRAVALGGGVNSSAAKALGITKESLDDLIAGDPALASELYTVNDAPAARRPKAG